MSFSLIYSTGLIRSVEPSDTLSLLHTAGDQDCLQGPHQRSPVLFGVDSVCGCTLRQGTVQHTADHPIQAQCGQRLFMLLMSSVPQTAGCCQLLPALSNPAPRVERCSPSPVRGLLWKCSLRQSAGMGAGPEQLQTWREYSRTTWWENVFKRLQLRICADVQSTVKLLKKLFQLLRYVC